MTETVRPPIETTVALFDKNEASWDVIASSVLAIAKEAVDWNENDPVLGKSDGDISYPSLKGAFLAEDTTIVIQTNKTTNELVGYSFAMPLRKFDQTREEEHDTAYVYMTMIDEKMRGQKLVVPLNTLMMQALHDQGYAYAERDAMYGFDEEGKQITEGGYPQSLTRGFGESIVAAYDYTPYPQYGLQRHFRIDTGKYLEQNKTT